MRERRFYGQYPNNRRPGAGKPSQANQAAFDKAIEDVTAAATNLIRSLVTNAEPRDRKVDALRAKARNAVRFELHK